MTSQPHTQDVAKIARHITRGQARRLLMYPLLRDGSGLISSGGATGRHLREKGLTVRDPSSLAYDKITGFGLQVRAYLLSQSDGGERG